MRDIPRDHVIVEQLSVFEQSDLKNFRDRLEMEVKHLRSRIGIMVGALESVGSFLQL
jgi:hypothetical protein